jgi:hypothetical protein
MKGVAAQQTPQAREDLDNRLRSAYLIEWFLGHFSRDFAQELVILLDAEVRILARERQNLAAPQ